jgi:hypothetical protein
VSGAIVGQLIGLFVDNEFLAAAVVAAVGVASALSLTGAAPPWVAGLLLTLALPLALAASVWRTTLKARRERRDE